MALGLLLITCLTSNAEFWDNRVAAAGLQPQDTQIPGNPEQTEFVSSWFDFHRGYRIDVDQNGQEIRVDMELGELWRDVDPGYLPRTANEILQGRSRNMQNQPSETRRLISEAPQVQSIDSTLDELLREAEEEDIQQPPLRENATSNDNRSRPLLVVEQEDAQRRRAQREERRRAAFVRLFGTREEVEAQGENYQSPIGGMYQRAWERYRVAEEVRRAAPAVSPPNPHDQDQLYYFNDGTVGVVTNAIPPPEAEPSRAQTPSQVTGLDIDDGRPEPVAREDMQKNMECKVCYQQLASEALLPCGHLAMCRWCADQTVPFRPSGVESGAVLGGAQCPSCRRKVKRRVKIYFG